MKYLIIRYNNVKYFSQSHLIQNINKPNVSYIRHLAVLLIPPPTIYTRITPTKVCSRPVQLQLIVFELPSHLQTDLIEPEREVPLHVAGRMFLVVSVPRGQARTLDPVLLLLHYHLHLPHPQLLLLAL